MNELEFDKYLYEYKTEGIGPLLYRLILTIVPQTVRRYPPIIYSSTRTWNEDAFQELAHDFTLKKLLESGRLEYYLLTQETEDGLKRVMQRDLRHYLINNKRQSEASNLFERTRQILRSNSEFSPCKNYTGTPNETWGLLGWGNKKLAERSDEIIRTMFEVELPPLVRYRADSAKYSHLISNKDLERLLKTTLEKIDKCVEINLLMEGIRHRLHLFDTTFLSLDEPLKTGPNFDNTVYSNIIADPNDALEKLEIVPLAAELFQQLSDRQRAILALYLSNSEPTPEQMSRWVGVSRSTVYKDLDNITQLIKNTGLSQEEADGVLSELAKLGSDYLKQIDSNLTEWL